MTNKLFLQLRDFAPLSEIVLFINNNAFQLIEEIENLTEDFREQLYLAYQKYMLFMIKEQGESSLMPPPNYSREIKKRYTNIEIRLQILVDGRYKPLILFIKNEKRPSKYHKLLKTENYIFPQIKNSCKIKEKSVLKYNVFFGNYYKNEKKFLVINKDIVVDLFIEQDMDLCKKNNKFGVEVYMKGIINRFRVVYITKNEKL